MGYRLHYLTEYKKQYSDCARFSNCVPTINELFEWLNYRADHNNYYYWYDGNFPSATQVIEWEKDGVSDAIDTLRNMVAANNSWKDIPVYTCKDFELANKLEAEGIPHSDGDWSIDQHLRKNLIDLEQTDGITVQAVADFLKDALANAEPTIDYVRFEWV